MSTTLAGSLDDFSIQDVLQIVSFGRKTGCLTLRTETGAAAIVFKRGRVVAAVEDPSGGRPGDLERWLGYRHDDAIRRRILICLERLVPCRHDHFSFEAASAPPLVVAGRDISRETLGTGIDVVELLIELACAEKQAREPGAA